MNETVKKVGGVAVGIAMGATGTAAVLPNEAELKEQVRVAEAITLQTQATKNEVVKELVWLKERLGESGSYDLSAATSLEWDEAGLEKARELGISDREILQAGGIGKALYAKALATSQVCKR